MPGSEFIKMRKDELMLFGCVTRKMSEQEEGGGNSSLILNPLGSPSCACISSIKLDSHVDGLSQHAQLQKTQNLTGTGFAHGNLKVQHKDVSTLTDLCSSANLDEVEIVSLVTEQIPRYRLRADTLTQFIGYENQDWFIPHPVLSPESDTDFDLSPDLAKETLEYFVQSGSRVSQMTKTYNDIDAVTRLLEEKEKDLELAARIGQKLLQKNQTLEQRNDVLEDEVTVLRDQITQLRHELVQKTELLHIYQNHDNEGSESDSTEGTPVDFLQKKIRLLEDENFSLAQRTRQISLETDNLEDKELQLINEFTHQTSELALDNERMSDELSTKIDECNKQQEDITYLLAQVADLQSKFKQCKLENEELYGHLQAAKECQSDLTTELSDFKIRYDEVLELLHEAQEQIRNSRKKAYPSISRMGMYSSYVNPDSLASELESTFSSDSGSFNPNTRQLHNLKVFETVRYAKQHNANSLQTNNPSQLPHLYGAPAVHSSVFASGSICSIPQLNSAQYGSPFHARITSTPHGAGFRPYLNSADRAGASDSEGSVCAEGSEDSTYSSISSLGRPGVPGSNDLETALRRLSLRRQSEADYLSSVRQPFEDGTHTPNQCRTPDSIMSTGSAMSAFSGLTGVSGYSRRYQFPEKLQIVKPMEGSVTLHQWQQLATPHLGGIFEERPGVQIKGEKKLEEIDEVYTLTDLEEDEEVSHPGKIFDNTSTIYTYTTSTVLHPDDNTRVTPSGMSSQISAVSVAPSSCLSSCLNSPQGRERATSTFSTTLSLAKLLHERGILPIDQSAAAKQTEPSPSKENQEPPPATPCNSPEGSRPSTPPPFAPLKIPSLAAIGGALSRGAELLAGRPGRSSRASNRTTQITGSGVTTTEVLSPSTTASLANINLMEKLNQFGLTTVVASHGSLPKYTLPTYRYLKPTSPMTQLTSLRGLSISGSVGKTGLHSVTIAAGSATSTEPVIVDRAQVPPSSLSLANTYRTESPALELGTIGMLASFRKGGLS